MKPHLKSQTCPCRPAIAHRWNKDIKELRKANAIRQVTRNNKRRSEALMDLCHTICMTRTSSGQVGVEYPVLRAKLKQFEEELNGFGHIGWMAIRRHVNCNLKEAHFPIR
ncbi:hypothetical protein OMEGA_184 [Klebsiella phage vB_KaeM_KaOmega]|nr:hypothetical protein OMEGA_184 [Klebsiella phage vB_KaeM_KaOmega]